MLTDCSGVGDGWMQLAPHCELRLPLMLSSHPALEVFVASLSGSTQDFATLLPVSRLLCLLLGLELPLRWWL